MARVRSSVAATNTPQSVKSANVSESASVQPQSTPPTAEQNQADTRRADARCSCESTPPTVEPNQEPADCRSPHFACVPEPRGLRLEWWEADRLSEHPANWRRHPACQKQAVAQLLQEVGWAGALLYNERTGRLLDGHLRKELARRQKVPVLIGSWSAEQERKILALLDPLTALAEPDPERWQELLSTLGETDASLAAALLAFAQQSELPLPPDILTATDANRAEANLPTSRFELIVECPDETSQRQLYERLTAEGWRCRVLAF